MCSQCTAWTGGSRSRWRDTTRSFTFPSRRQTVGFKWLGFGGFSFANNGTWNYLFRWEMFAIMNPFFRRVSKFLTAIQPLKRSSPLDRDIVRPILLGCGWWDDYLKNGRTIQQYKNRFIGISFFKLHQKQNIKNNIICNEKNPHKTVIKIQKY